MKASEYVKRVIETESNDFQKLGERMSLPRNIRVFHSAVGNMTEVGELFEMLAKPMLDLTNLREECGDSCWYLALVADELKFDFDKIVKEAQSISDNQKTSLFLKINKKAAINKTLASATIESGKYLDLLKKSVFYGKELDLAKVENQVTLVLADMITLLKIGNFMDIEEVFDINIKKLQEKRFKNKKFTENEALVRNIEEERKTLEGK